MKLEVKALASGQSVIRGFAQDDQFVPIDAIENYCMAEFRGHEEFTSSQQSFFNSTGMELELVNLTGGTYFGNTPDFATLTSLKAWYKPRETSSDYPNNTIFSLTPNAPMPYAFPKGLILPPNAYFVFATDLALAFARLVMKPVFPVSVGNLIHYP
jgi:hypothetical protein